MPGRTTAKRRYSIVFGCLVSVFLALLFYIIFSTTVRNLQKEYASDLYLGYTEILQDSLDTLLPLNDLNYTTCSAENLRAMEAALFKSVHPKQIMFYVDGEGICSTGSGILDMPVRRPAPDFIAPANQEEIWVNRDIQLNLTGETYNALVIKKDNYSVLLPANILRPTMPVLFDWKLVFRDLDIDVIAEGIETEMQRGILFELGVRYGQGWLFGKAMGSADLAGLVSRRKKIQLVPAFGVGKAS